LFTSFYNGHIFAKIAVKPEDRSTTTTRQKRNQVPANLKKPAGNSIFLVHKKFPKTKFPVSPLRKGGGGNFYGISLLKVS